MTASEVRALMYLAIGDTPHELGTVEQADYFIGYMTRADLIHAGRCYAAIVGERQLPAHIGIKHAQKVLAKPLSGRAQAIRAAQARGILEDRKYETRSDNCGPLTVATSGSRNG
jgi:hypothetical protein